MRRVLFGVLFSVGLAVVLAGCDSLTGLANVSAGGLFSCSVHDDGTWVPTELLGSHALVGIAGAGALVVVGSGIRRIAAGSSVELIPLWG